MNLIDTIESAFKNRKAPTILTNSKQLDDAEFQELMAFSHKEWDEINCSLLEENFEVINWFSPQAFCFFLPAICLAAIKEKMPDLLISDSIIQMLDRSPTPSYWDTFFVERWALLTPEECEAIQEWLLWLSSCEEVIYDELTISRAFDTLDFLKQGVTALR